MMLICYAFEMSYAYHTCVLCTYDLRGIWLSASPY